MLVSKPHPRTQRRVGSGKLAYKSADFLQVPFGWDCVIAFLSMEACLCNNNMPNLIDISWKAVMKRIAVFGFTT